MSLNTSAWLILGFGLLLFILLAGLKAGLGGFGARYQKRGNLFTPAELNFLRALDRAVGQKLRIFGKVRVADVLSVKGGTNRRANWNAFAKISGKHFDYVLCDPQTLNVLGVVELNDKSHDRRDRQLRDALIRRACLEAGMPLIEVPAARTYNPIQIHDSIFAALGTQTSAH